MAMVVATSIESRMSTEIRNWNVTASATAAMPGAWPGLRFFIGLLIDSTNQV